MKEDYCILLPEDFEERLQMAYHELQVDFVNALHKVTIGSLLAMTDVKAPRFWVMGKAADTDRLHLQ